MAQIVVYVLVALVGLIGLACTLALFVKEDASCSELMPPFSPPYDCLQQ